MKKPKVKLENWSVVDSLLLQDFRDLAPGQRLSGRVSKLFGIPQGTIFSATIVYVDRKKHRVETPHAIYKLGSVNQAYERWADQRVTAPSALRYPAQRVVGVPVGTAQALR
ncbi:MAG TPA: hypothetical protein VHX37_13050 [Acidobacteriaceae bacterium]|jgi:hypothetical protein|nr:hypothetical protein [Acidobacteriaceae bacterium]